MSKYIVFNTWTPDKPNIKQMNNIHKMQTLKLYLAEFVSVWDWSSNNLKWKY